MRKTLDPIQCKLRLQQLHAVPAKHFSLQTGISTASQIGHSEVEPGLRKHNPGWTCEPQSRMGDDDIQGDTVSLRVSDSFQAPTAHYCRTTCNTDTVLLVAVPQTRNHNTRIHKTRSVHPAYNARDPHCVQDTQDASATRTAPHCVAPRDCIALTTNHHNHHLYCSPEATHHQAQGIHTCIPTRDAETGARVLSVLCKDLPVYLCLQAAGA